MKKERIPELRSLHAEATEGPWEYYDEDKPIVMLGQDGDSFFIECERAADARFIAVCRSALPELLDEVERLRREMQIALAELGATATTDAILRLARVLGEESDQ